MAYKVFSNGSVLNASEINDNLMNQAVMVFSNEAARTAAITSPVEGMLTWLEDVNRYDSWSGSAWLPVITPGAWTAFTPTWNSGLTVGNGVYNTSHYTLVGKTATVAIDFSLGTTSAVSGDMTIDVPVAIARKNTFSTGIVYGIFADTGSANYSLSAQAVTASSQRFALRTLLTPSGANPVVVTAGAASATTPFIWTTNDRIIFSATYEVA